MKVPRCVSILLLKLCNNKSKKRPSIALQFLLRIFTATRGKWPCCSCLGKKKANLLVPPCSHNLPLSGGTACCLQYSSNDWSRKETSSWSRRCVQQLQESLRLLLPKRQKTRCFVTVTGFRLMITTRKKYKCTKNGNLSVP